MSAFGETEQEQRNKKKPNPDVDTIASFVLQNWSKTVIPASVKRIDSYDDANFYLEAVGNTGSKGSYLVKYYNAVETVCPDILHGLSHMLNSVNDNIKIPLQVPTIIPPSGNSENNFVFDTACKTAEGGAEKVAVRLFHWIHGTTMSRMKPNLRLMTELGTGIGHVWQSLREFDHPSFHRTHLWDLKQFSMSYPLLSYVEDPLVREHIQSVHSLYTETILPVSDQFKQSVIMGDCNDANVIVTDVANAADAADCKVEGLIDFSDAVHTWSVNEIAIAMAYALLNAYGKEAEHRHKSIGALLAGYTSVHPLSDVEIQSLPVLILTRLSISVMVGACAISKSPDDAYLKLHAVPGRDAIKFLCSVDLSKHSQFFKRIQQTFASTSTTTSSTCSNDNSLTQDAVYDSLISECYM
mmetsp:Transcript_1044/g.1730  ORF Transcript_1044/g.1730 Transcript_1044/m.1730 type:complete len:411 (+) Transcript_1044:72-1304(+)|eukprot:CAMPEP_0174975434 /NCGR_PEP_ID=MMETSP0004_2-20121128/12444_1 /TAXON_ID=420556 /ORGANISM="Ochromonas sp., Strain CCMP1393" /LENGTH=410 /DNA_ID=CAMNT_0016226291 /DNA_START=72 /DNA_END=1304 /DNA_ORIENTATION=-